MNPKTAALAEVLTDLPDAPSQVRLRLGAELLYSLGLLARPGLEENEPTAISVHGVDDVDAIDRTRVSDLEPRFLDEDIEEDRGREAEDGGLDHVVTRPQCMRRKPSS